MQKIIRRIEFWKILYLEVMEKTSSITHVFSMPSVTALVTRSATRTSANTMTAITDCKIYARSVGLFFIHFMRYRYSYALGREQKYIAGYAEHAAAESVHCTRSEIEYALGRRRIRAVEVYYRRLPVPVSMRVPGIIIAVVFT